MTGTPDRVAVHAGASMVRIAGTVAGGEPRILMELPSHSPSRPLDPDAVGDLLAGLFATPPAELLLVHPTGRAPPRTGWDGLAGVVRAVPSSVAAATAVARSDLRAGLVVLDIGHSGAEATLLGRGGRPVWTRSCPVGGSRLDEVVLDLLLARCPAAVSASDVAVQAALRAEARRLREALSLVPVMTARLPWTGTQVRLAATEVRAGLAGPLAEVVDAVRAVLGPGPPGVMSGVRTPILLVGGVARAPLLAELLDAAVLDAAVLDAAVLENVVVAPRPDAAAVLGALRLPEAALPRLGPAGPSASRPIGSAVPSGWLPPLPPRRPGAVRVAMAMTVCATAAAALISVGTVLAPGPASPPPLPVASGVVAQYGYAMELPPGWAHTGGLPERRRTLLTPEARPEGSDLVSVERTPLGYDAGVERERADAELRAEFDAAVAAGAPLSAFDPTGRYQGRPVVIYRQLSSDGRVAVDWYVLLDGDDQLSVGCQYTVPGAVEVRRACELVVGSVRTS
ncbi:MAG: type VII secretion-associated protein [Pseudonocardia sp.]